MATISVRPAHTRVGDPGLAQRLSAAVQGDVLFTPFDRARYATDASIYQIEPIGVIRPRIKTDVEAAIAIAREEGVSILPRGGGTSQAGQTVGRSLVLDNSRWLTGVSDLDTDARTVWVEPGVVLDDLNRTLKEHGLFYPVDVSTSSRATIGGMTANNSCGSRSLRYGVSIDNVLEIEAVLADGSTVRFGQVGANLEGVGDHRVADMARDLNALGAREAAAIAARFPQTARQVGGYALDRIKPQGSWNLASILVGSEGTLAYFTRIKLKLSPLPKHRLMGVCHFPSFRGAMEAAQHLVRLDPTCVELVDRSILDLAEGIPAFASSLKRFVRGRPGSLLLVEFAGEEPERNEQDLRRLHELMGDLGYPDAVVDARDGALIAEITALRTAGLNIAMSMKGAGKPISFIEDCAVPLPDLAEYTEGLNEVFARHGTSGTWYAHASVGCLHVRPILNLKEEKDVRTMRAIAEEAIALVRRFKGAHSGEHGDGLVRSSWHETVFGSRLMRSFEEVKDRFDPNEVFNAHPSKIVRAPAFDDRSLMRAAPGKTPLPFEPVLDWSAWGGLLGATEMCNNNGTCRKAQGGAMCPSYRVTRDERDVTRGRANVLRLALTGELGPEAMGSTAMKEAMQLCVSCKACKRECPTGVDMARMKLELQAHWRQQDGLSWRDRAVAHLPHYAEAASGFSWLAGLRAALPGAAWLGEQALGIRAERSLPPMHRYRPWASTADRGGAPLVLFGDTFNLRFEPDNITSARQLFEASGYRVVDPTPPGERPLCCGRTFLAAGMVEEARAELRRSIGALKPHLDAGLPIVGLEPSCVFTFRDELEALLPASERLNFVNAVQLLPEWLLNEADAGRFAPTWRQTQERVLVHGHCHEKAFGVFDQVVQALKLPPGLEVATIESSCCGMAGAFGYYPEHREVSNRMAEANLLPAVRAADDATIIVADGTSCRHQIADGTTRRAKHMAVVLADQLAPTGVAG